MREPFDHPKEPELLCSGFGLGLGIGLDDPSEGDGGPSPPAIVDHGGSMGRYGLGFLVLGAGDDF